MPCTRIQQEKEALDDLATELELTDEDDLVLCVFLTPAPLPILDLH